MSDSEAQIGFGSTLSFADVGATEEALIVNIIGFTPPKVKVGVVQTERFDSDTFNGQPVTEKNPGWVDAGEFGVKILYRQDQAAALWAAIGVLQEFRYRRPAPNETHGYDFVAFISEHGDEVPLKEDMTLDITLTLKGVATQV